MKITINGASYRVPTSLADVTLAQRIGYDKEHGVKLRAELKRILDIKDKVLQDMDFSVYSMDLACRSVSYFLKIPLDIVQKVDMGDTFAVYSTFLKLITEDTDFTDAEKLIVHEFEWQGDTWCIAPIELTQKSKMDFGEFVDAKQIVQNLYELSQEKWEALLILCCIYLRKKGEPYEESLTDESGPRYKQFLSLPLDKALNVGFFLKGSINIYQNSFPYSGPAEPNLVAGQ